MSPRQSPLVLLLGDANPAIEPTMIRAASERGAEANRDMIDTLVRTGRLRNPRIEDAFRAVPRHWFLPDHDVGEVYSGRAIVTHTGSDGQPISSSSEPAIMAVMLEQLDVHPGQRVLEIGTGTGYNAALLGHLVGRSGEVVSIDLDPHVTAAAEQNLRAAGASNVAVTTGDGWNISDHRGPFDRIESTVGVWDLARAWVDQLARDGILVVPLWLRAGLQASIAFTRTADHLRSLSVQPCGFMRLRGSGSGPESYVAIGDWKVCIDEPQPERIALLGELLQQSPTTSPAPVQGAGWFTGAALTEADAVNLVTYRSGTPRSFAGILDVESQTLAVIELGAPTALHAYGGDQARTRLEDLARRTPPVDLSTLDVIAVATGGGLSDADRLAVLTRPNFTFVVSAG